MSISCDWLVCINSNYRLFGRLGQRFFWGSVESRKHFFCFTGYGGVGLSHVDGY